MTEALDRVEADEAGPGEIIAVAGLPDVTIGETLADPDDPRPLPGDRRRRAVALDDDRDQHVAPGRSVRATSSRRASWRRGFAPSSSATSRSASCRRSRPDAWEVQGRGELQLAVLVEQMRREGFELTVGKPQVVTREIDGRVHEPVERVSVDAPEEYLGVLTQLFALRKGRTEALVNHGSGWVRMDVIVPARGIDRLPHGVPDGDARHGHPASRVRALRAVVRRAPHAADGRARRRPAGQDDVARDPEPPGARLALRRSRRRRLRGDDRRRERANRGPRRQRDEGEEAHQHTQRRRRIRRFG